MKFKMKKNDPTQVAIILENEQEILEMFCLFNYAPVGDSNELFVSIYESLYGHKEEYKKELPSVQDYIKTFSSMSNDIEEGVRE